MPERRVVEVLTAKGAGPQRSLPACVHVPERNIEAERRWDSGLRSPVQLRSRFGNLPGSSPRLLIHLIRGVLMVSLRQLMADRHVDGGHLGNSDL
jgi:hypothetical protein